MNKNQVDIADSAKEESNPEPIPESAESLAHREGEEPGQRHGHNHAGEDKEERGREVLAKTEEDALVDTG